MDSKNEKYSLSSLTHSQLFNLHHFKGKRTNGESALAEIIEKILKESGIKGVAVNSRMITAFRKKIWLLEGKVDSARKKGGACVRRLLDKRKSSKYAFTLYITS